jgi:hypothetical protein
LEQLRLAREFKEQAELWRDRYTRLTVDYENMRDEYNSFRENS